MIPCIFRELDPLVANVRANDLVIDGNDIWSETRDSIERVKTTTGRESMTPNSLGRFDCYGRRIYYVSKTYFCPSSHTFWVADATPRVTVRMLFGLNSNTMRELRAEDKHLADQLSLEHDFNPPFVVKRKSAERLRWRDVNELYIFVGPWKMSFNDEKTIELKRWLYDSRQRPRAEVRSIIERAASRRHRRFGLTTGERTFFAAMFGARAILKWTEKQNNHEE